jgi:SAM-dependent methyltransferase
VTVADHQDYQEVNRRGWDELARMGCESSTPWDIGRMSEPEKWLDGFGWLPWGRIRDVLVLAGAGGQQAPLFARLGCRVTVVDLSPAQLRRDRSLAERLGLELECVQGDMCDLSVLGDRRYDLVYQPVSTCYVPDVGRCYRAVASVVRSGGLYWSQHWNPTQIQLSASRAWDGSAYRIERPVVDRSPVVLSASGWDAGPLCWHYVHPLTELIGGICAAGFTIERFAEYGASDLGSAPGGSAHLAAYLPPFYVVLAQRSPRRPT